MAEQVSTTTEEIDPPEQAAALLHRLAEEYGPDSKLPSVRELSRRFGASSSELSAALDEMERDELVYRRHRVGVFVSDKILRKNTHIILEPRMLQNPGASPVWAQVWAMLLGIAEQRATDGESFTFHLSNTLQQPGPIRDIFHRDLERGRVNVVLGMGLNYHLVHEINRYRVPVITLAGAGNHVVASTMHAQIQTVTGMLADAGCARMELWCRANTGNSPFAFTLYDIVDVAGMISRLRDPYDRPAQRIAVKATAETARRLAAFRETDAATFDLRQRLADIVNMAQYQGGLYDERVFDDIELRPETREALLARDGGETTLMTANRLLLQDTFPTEIARGAESESDSVSAFRLVMRQRFPEIETAVVRRAGRSEGGDVGNQLPGYNLARTIFGAPGPHPDGLVIEDDMIASGVHKALEELGVRIGVDVKIATHANAGSAIGFGLHGRVIQMLLDPTEFAHAMFALMDQDTSQDLDRMTIVRIEPRILAPNRPI